MQDAKRQSGTLVYTAAACLLVTVLALRLFRVDDPYLLCLLLLTVCWAVLRPLPRREWTAVDGCLCLLTAYDLFTLAWALSPRAAVPDALLSLFCLSAYFVMRRLFASERAGRLFLYGSYLPIGAALLLAVCSFFVFRRSVLAAGFEDTYPFRFLFRPLGYITNVWAEVLLLILGWCCLAKRCAAPLVLLAVGALLLSFSRGAYIAFGVYLAGWLLWVKPWREKLRLPLLGLLAIVLVMAFFPVEMKTTVQMNRTFSQRQSTEGRLHATRMAWEAFRERPLLGYGNGTYTLALDGMNQDSTRPYTSIAPNLPVLLGIEKGACGILLCLLLTMAVCRCLWKNRVRRECQVMACLFPALFAKEMAQATLPTTPFSLFLFYACLAYMQRQPLSEETPKTTGAAGMTRYLLPAMALAGWAGGLCSHLRVAHEEECLQQGKAALERGDYAGALQQMKQAGEGTAALVNRALLNRACFIRTGTPAYREKAETLLQEAACRQPQDLQLRYLQARLSLDGDEPEQAYLSIREPAAMYPRNAFYQWALSEALYRMGRRAEALPPLLHAVRLMPRLLDSGGYLSRLQQTDSLFFRQVKDNLAAEQPTADSTPADYARLGYIARWCGDRAVSDVWLRRAVAVLPNLATPWRLLGDEAKCRLLLYGAFRKADTPGTLPDEMNTPDEDTLFLRSYSPKFSGWYGGALLL